MNTAFLRRNRWELLLGAILLAIVIHNVVRSTNYLSIGNFANIFHLSIEKVIVAVIMTFVIVNAEIDLAVASVMALSAATLGALFEHRAVPFVVAVLIAIAVGALAGLLNGLAVVGLGLPSLVVTLAGLIGFRGLARVLIEDRSIGGFPSWFNTLGQKPFISRFPITVIGFFVFIAIAGVILSRTALGRRIRVIGDNAEVARYSGINVGRTKIWLFVASGTVAAVAGVLFASRLGAVRGDMAKGFELDIITMVLLGGVSIFGGRGTMTGVFLAILIVLNLRNGLGLANVEANIQTGWIGALLVLSVVARNVLDHFDRRAGAAPSSISISPEPQPHQQQGAPT